MKKKSYFESISVNDLFRTFPGFIFRDAGLEIVGYNPQNNQHLVIDDGLCVSGDYGWCVHIYQLNNPPKDYSWLTWKYIVDEPWAKKILEKRYNF